MAEAPVSKTDRPPSRRGLVARRILALAILVAVIAGSILLLRVVEAEPMHDAAPAAGAPLPVRVVEVQPERTPIEPRYLGRTEASQSVEIRARVAGYLRERSFDEGTEVTEGQSLFRIDPRPFETALARARAERARASATHAHAALQVTRYEALTERESATAVELEEWQQQEAVAAADVALADAAIAAAELDLGYTHITAPMTGMIGETLREVGSYVDAGSNGLMAVVRQVDPIDVRIAITERDVLEWRRRVASGEIESPPAEAMQVALTLSDGSVYPHIGSIRYLDVAVDDATGTLIVRASFPNPDHVLRPGQFVHATMLDVYEVNVLCVPRNAVLHDATGTRVFVVTDDGTVAVRPVTTGAWSGDDAWIIETGLEPGDRVITNRLMMLRPEMPVQVITEPGDDA